MLPIHIVDPDVRRRASVARSIYSSQHHGEIYENFREFHDYSPELGLVLTATEERRAVSNAVSAGRLIMPVVFYGSSPAIAEVTSAMRAGALDFIEWPFEQPGIGQRLESLVSEALEYAAKLETRRAALDSLAKLSPRELQVLHGVICGGSNKSIAEELGISDRTVEIHRSNMMLKLQARSSAEAIRIGLHGGLDKSFELLNIQ